MRLSLLLIPVLLIAGCTQFPDVDAAIGDEVAKAPYPALVPLGPLLTADSPARLDEGSEAALTARADGLRRRARALRASDPVSGDEERRLQERPGT
ncbi:hypothetical protein SAMN04490248_11692 [Salinihabitans flavidus]|uniref:Uncharacterized protein n=1 Tax=Salinihabitans flavidus TaxID=569882 RepID=A0A1H8TR77_9RHOB|nr:hypothetical protein [Salinihabitans flavidus]SEO93519.1 hypothetical protein SAMN04490248_11692 [Salinihabitans flavidus]